MQTLPDAPWVADELYDRAVWIEDLARPEIFDLIYEPMRLMAEAIDHPGGNYIPASEKDRDQESFHRSQAMHRIILGGNQSGKTRAAAQEIRWLALDEHPWQDSRPGIDIWVVSASYQTIQNGIYRHLLDIIPPWRIRRRGTKIQGVDVPKYIEVDTGSKISFFSAVGANAARRGLQSAAIDHAFIDEEVDDPVWQELDKRRLVRGGRTVISATAVESVDWLLDLEERYESGDKNVHLVRMSTVEAAKAGHVDQSTLDEILHAATDEEREIRIFGKTKRKHGLIYPEFGPSHVCSPFEIPKEWARYMAIDPGWGTFACLWIAVSPDQRFYVYRELYRHRSHVDDIVDEIRAAEGWELNPAFNDEAAVDKRSKWLWKPGESEDIAIRYVDPKNFGNNPGGGLMVGNLLSLDYDLHCVPATNDVEMGIERVKRTLMNHWDGTPRTQVFSSCVSFLKERSRYRRKSPETPGSQTNERHPTPVKKQDHLMDCWRYLCVSGMEPATSENFSRMVDNDPSLYPGARGGSVLDFLHEARPNWSNEPETVSASGLGSEF